MDERKQIEAAVAALESAGSALDRESIEVAVRVLRSHLARISDDRRDQRKLVTVLFADVSGFTSWVERTDPEEVTAAVNALWQRVDTTIAEHGGTVDKHIGDAVMALFGAPTAREDDAERAVRAALAIQETLRTVATDAGWAEAELKMRIGLHTGPVYLGIVGTTGEYTAMGDTVNLASRLQAAASEDGVLVSGDTWRHVRDSFEADPREPIQFKGKSKPIRTFEVRAEKPLAGRRALYEVGGVATPLVGRDGTLRLLEQRLDEVIERSKGGAIVVSGELGMGKSRVVDTFLDRVADSDRSILMLRARAHRDAGRMPYALLRDLFASRFRILDSDSDPIALAKLESGIADLLAERPEETAHLIGHLIGLDLGHSEHLAGAIHDPVNLRDRAISAVVRLIQNLAGRNPVLMTLENLHRADEGSLRIARVLCANAVDIPLLVLISAAPSLKDADPDFLKNTGAAALSLNPLNDTDAERLVRTLLRRGPLSSDSVVLRILETAGGHPYYLEELARMVMEIDQGDPCCSLDDQDLDQHLQVPPTLTALLQARLDSLPDGQRSLLQRASIIGRVFWGSCLSYLCETEQSLDVADLIDRELIREHSQSSFDGSKQFAFRSSLLQEVAYETVLLRDRRVFHERVAHWLSEQAGDATLLWASRIAEHWEGASNSKAAAAWFLRAGEHARRTSAFAEAADSYSRALAHMAHDPDAGALRLAAHDGLNELRRVQGRHDDARAAAEAMLAEAKELNDEGGQARAWAALSRTYQAISQLDNALDAARKAVQLATGARAVKTLCQATIEQGICLFRLGKLNESSSVLDTALDVGSREGLKLEQAIALRLQGAVQARLGRFGPAERHAEKALELLRKLGDSLRTTACLLSLGELARVRGDMRRAANRYNEALDLARRLGMSSLELVGMSNLGGVLVSLGEISTGEDMIREVLARAPENWYGLPETWRFLAEARLVAGDFDDAMKTGTHALSLCLKSGNAELIGPAWRILGQISSAAGVPVVLEDGELAARACFEESRRVLTEANLNPEEARTLRAWAKHELVHGDKELGRKLWSQAREWFHLLGMDIEIARTPEQTPAA